MTTKEFIDYCDSFDEKTQFKDYLLNTKQYDRANLLMKLYAQQKCKDLLEIVAEKADEAHVGGWDLDRDEVLNAVDLKEFIK